MSTITLAQISRLIRLSQEKRITKNDLDAFLDGKEATTQLDDTTPPNTPIKMDVFDMTLVELFVDLPGSLGSRIRNSFDPHDQFDDDSPIYMGDLLQMSIKKFLRMKNLGRKSLKLVESVLQKHGLRLGMHIPGWIRPDRR